MSEKTEQGIQLDPPRVPDAREAVQARPSALARETAGDENMDRKMMTGAVLGGLLGALLGNCVLFGLLAFDEAWKGTFPARLAQIAMRAHQADIFGWLFFGGLSGGVLGMLVGLGVVAERALPSARGTLPGRPDLDRMAERLLAEQRADRLAGGDGHGPA